MRRSAVTVVRAYYACMNARRLDEGAALVSPDCVFSHATTRERAYGPGGYRTLVQGWLDAAPDFRITADAIASDRDGEFRVAVRLRGHLDGPFQFGPIVVQGDGQSFDIAGTHVIGVRDGLIVRSDFSFDRGGFERQPRRARRARAARPRR
jgi:predicted ester cyclase